jgi:hypothetical protein
MDDKDPHIASSNLFNILTTTMGNKDPHIVSSNLFNILTTYQKPLLRPVSYPIYIKQQ